MARTILVVEDEPTLRETLAEALEADGFRVVSAGDGRMALERLRAEHPDLVLLDLMLPEISGIDVCRIIRAESPVPIIMLTARGSEVDKVVGLELGADDYVTKPFSPRELVLRVQSVLRRSGGPLTPAQAEVLVDGDLSVDLAAHQATQGGLPLGLTAREYDLLVFLLQHPRQAFSREELLKQVWGWEYADHSTVTVHVRRLREKVERDPRAPERVVTVFGVGYRYEPLQESA